MKKFIFVALCFVMAITAYASSENKYRYDYESSDITIVFDENMQKKLPDAGSLYTMHKSSIW